MESTESCLLPKGFALERKRTSIDVVHVDSNKPDKRHRGNIFVLDM